MVKENMAVLTLTAVIATWPYSLITWHLFNHLAQGHRCYIHSIPVLGDTWLSHLFHKLLFHVSPAAGELYNLRLSLSLFPDHHFLQVPATTSAPPVVPDTHTPHLPDWHRLNNELIHLNQRVRDREIYEEDIYVNCLGESITAKVCGKSC